MRIKQIELTDLTPADYNPRKDETSKPNPPEPSGGDGKAVAYGLIAGVMTSIIFGFIMDDKALGLAIGAGVGITLGAAFSAKKRSK